MGLKKKLLGVSTGGFHLYAQGYATAYAMSKMDFDLMIGGSSGACIVAVAAIHGREKLVDIINSIDLRKAYSFIPFKANGKIKPRAIFRFLTGRSLAIQDNIQILKDVISEDDFKAYLRNHNAPEAYVVTVDLNSKKTILWNLKKCTYEQAIFGIWTSTLMQGISKGLYAPKHFPKCMHGYHVDAGQRDHVQTHYLLNESIDTLVSVYSRPEDWQLPYKEMHPIWGGWEEHFEMIKMDNKEKFDEDIWKEGMMCEYHDIKRYQIWMDRLDHSFDMNPDNQQKVINSAMLSARKAFS